MLIHEQLGIYKVELPLLHRVKHVNCYAIKGRNGWCLIDAGLSREATYQGWLRFFEEQAVKASDIKGIYLTHYHSDHYGSSGWLQDYSGAPVNIGAIDAKRINNYWKKGDYLLEAIGALYRSHGMPEEAIRRVIEAEAKIIPLTLPHAELTTLEDGQTVNLGDYAYRVFFTPGHSDGHICFYNEEHGLLFSGDHLLPDTSSIIGISAQPGTIPDPLADFFSSLISIGSLNCTLVLPAHGKSFANIEKRIKRLESYHLKHLELTKNSISSSATTYEVCSHIYSSDISGNELRFAMAETMAHLVYLANKGELEVVLEDGIYRYRRRED